MLFFDHHNLMQFKGFFICIDNLLAILFKLFWARNFRSGYLKRAEEAKRKFIEEE